MKQKFTGDAKISLGENEATKMCVLRLRLVYPCSHIRCWRRFGLFLFSGFSFAELGLPKSMPRVPAASQGRCEVSQCQFYLLPHLSTRDHGPATKTSLRVRHLQQQGVVKQCCHWHRLVVCNGRRASASCLRSKRGGGYILYG